MGEHIRTWVAQGNGMIWFVSVSLSTVGMGGGLSMLFALQRHWVAFGMVYGAALLVVAAFIEVLRDLMRRAAGWDEEREKEYFRLVTHAVQMNAILAGLLGWEFSAWMETPDGKTVGMRK